MSRGRKVLKETVEWALVLVVLAGGWLAFHHSGATVAMVRTESMEPAIYPADIVIATPGTPQLGDVVVFEPIVVGETLPTFVHRLTAIKPDGTWQTKGDNNQYPDSAKVPTENIHGIVRHVLPTRWLKHPATPIAGGALLGLMAGLWLYRWARKDARAELA